MWLQQFMFIFGMVLPVVLNFLLIETWAHPAATAQPPTTHIVSYVRQRKSKTRYSEELKEFDFESIKSKVTAVEGMNDEMLKQVFGKYVQKFEENVDNSLMMSSSTPETTTTMQETAKTNETIKMLPMDDMPAQNEQNTLDTNEVFGNNDQHESIVPDYRAKQSIPVLKPVRDLINAVRNHTAHTNNDRHQLIKGHHIPHHNESSEAIETEEEREMVSDSNSFKLLEIFGSLGSMIWTFVRNAFAASAASSSSSGSS